MAPIGRGKPDSMSLTRASHAGLSIMLELIHARPPSSRGSPAAYLSGLPSLNSAA